MYTSSSSLFVVNHQARAIRPQKAFKDQQHRFLVGTCAVHDTNELSVIEYHEDSNSIEAIAVYQHADQIWALESSPHNAAIVMTSWSSSSSATKGVSIWRLPSQANDSTSPSNNYVDERPSLHKLGDCKLDYFTTYCNMEWHPAKDDVLISDNKGLWLINTSSYDPQIVSTVSLSPESLSLISCAISWDPHASQLCAAACDADLSFVDLRKKIVTASVARAHSGCTIRDVDYNPNKPLTVATCGDDGSVNIWDMRNLTLPVKTLQGHSHWVTCVRYNPFHDQLLISGGTDCAVSLWRVASCSSAPWIGDDELSADVLTFGYEDGEELRTHSYGSSNSESPHSGDSAGVPRRVKDPPDVKVRHVDQHEESVYNVAWSPADAWVYCSLSYDGRVIVNHVPSTEKYKILL